MTNRRFVSETVVTPLVEYIMELSPAATWEEDHFPNRVRHKQADMYLKITVKSRGFQYTTKQYQFYQKKDDTDYNLARNSEAGRKF